MGAMAETNEPRSNLTEMLAQWEELKTSDGMRQALIEVRKDEVAARVESH
jgi:predicted N-formylglutamate amidohydrolase